MAAPVSPLALPVSPVAPPTVPVLPTPEVTISDTAGALVGQLVVVTDAGERPVSNLKFALAAVIVDDNGVPKVAGYEASTAPSTYTDEFGRFALSNLPASNYAIILDAVLTQYLLNQPGIEDSIILEVKANEITDLGRLEYASIPIPGYQAPVEEEPAGEAPADGGG